MLIFDPAGGHEDRNPNFIVVLIYCLYYIIKTQELVICENVFIFIFPKVWESSFSICPGIGNVHLNENYVYSKKGAWRGVVTARIEQCIKQLNISLLLNIRSPMVTYTSTK